MSDKLISLESVLKETRRFKGYIDDDMIERFSIAFKRLTTVEQPMSAVEYDKQSRRMCKYYNGRCIGCPFNSDLAAGCARYAPLSEEAVSRLDKWAKKHPEEVNGDE